MDMSAFLNTHLESVVNANIKMGLRICCVPFARREMKRLYKYRNGMSYQQYFISVGPIHGMRYFRNGISLKSCGHICHRADTYIGTGDSTLGELVSINNLCCRCKTKGESIRCIICKHE